MLPSTRPLTRSARRLALLAGVAACIPITLTNPIVAPLHAQDAPPSRQSGRLAGTVTDANQQPLSGAQVSLVGTRFGVITGADGRYRLTGIPAGSYDVRVQRIGQRTRIYPGVAVQGGAEATLAATLETAPAALGGVVVSASRRVEKITDAPATVTSIGTEQLDASVGNTFASALKEAKGLDFIQTGMTSVAINARGFNSSFNNRMLMVEDGRISVMPENGLPVGNFTPTPKVDLAGIEVLVGPGSALYGPDAANGVLSLRTKDPRQFPGATLEVTGGNRKYMDVQGRYAKAVGNFGYKVSGEYQQANDWDNLPLLQLGRRPRGPADGDARGAGGGRCARTGCATASTGTRASCAEAAAAVYYMGDNRLELNGGMSRTNGVGQTNVGRNQLRGWKYNVQQARYTTPHWYLNAYRAQSQSGKSFALNRYAGAQLTAGNAGLSADSLRMLSDWPSDGRMYAAEVQGNYIGADAAATRRRVRRAVRNDVVSSDRQWLTDRNTKEDISNDAAAASTHRRRRRSCRGSTWCSPAAYDDPESYAAQWSPKAGVVFKPMADQAFRVTFNRAFKSPTILQTNFFIPDWTSIISIYGNTTASRRSNAAGTTRVRLQADRARDEQDVGVRLQGRHP